MGEEKPKRIFINQIDTYHGHNFAKYLSHCVVGASLDEPEEEEEETRSVDSGFEPTKPKDGCYKILGTVKDPTYKVPDFIDEVIKYETKEQLFEHLVECDVIIYDITQDPDQIEEAVWAISEIHSDLDKLDSQKMFVLLTSVMTWAKSKPIDPDDPETPFTEEDYRRRKPHPNFKEHIAAEKTVIRLGKTNKARLISYVVAVGLTYGAGENIFHFLFKNAWQNAPVLSVFGNGQNVLPTMHVRDLAAVLQNVADSKPKTRYIVAADDSRNSLEEIVRNISTNLTTGAIKNITKEEAMLNKDMEQLQFDQLLVSLRFEAVFVKESMRIPWVCETGMVEGIQTVIKEFKQIRRLQPIKICVLGPPAVGKTTLVKHLCEFYKLHHVHVKDVIDEAINNLEKSMAKTATEEGEDEDGKAAEDADLLEALMENKSENNGRLDNHYVTRFFKEKLSSMPCQNQGFVLDGYPKTKEQAEDLFVAEDTGEEEESDDKKPSFNKLIMPDFVYIFNATDDFLKMRVMHLPEIEVAGTHNTEEGLIRRLTEYRAINGEEENVITYFDEREIHPTYLDATKVVNKQMTDIVEKIRKGVGKPRNYGPTAEELAEIRKKEEEERIKREAEERAEKERLEAEEAMSKKRRQDDWADRLEMVRQEEYTLLEMQAMPMRNYLMKFVMPKVTEGLMQCGKVRPEDPVDYLAEFLLHQHGNIGGAS